MLEVEACKVKEHDSSDGKPLAMVVVPGCAACKAADDSLVEAMDGDESWRLPKAQRIRRADG